MSREERVVVPLEGARSIRAELFHPDGGAGPAPGLVVIHDITGLQDDTRRICRRFAEHGYAAIAPDLYDGRGPKPLCIARLFRELNTGPGPATTDLLAVRDWLGAREDVDDARIGVVGFCMGGGFTLMAAESGRFAVAAPYYGDVAEDRDRYRELCPVVAGFGGKDRMFAPKGELLQAHCEALGIPHDVKIYEGVGHSYMNQLPRWMVALSPLTPMHAKYDEVAAEDSWRRMLAFFGEHLAASA